MPLAAVPDMNWDAFNALPLSNPLAPAMNQGYLPIGDKWYTPAEWAGQVKQWSADLSNTEGGLMAWFSRNQTAVFVGAGALFVLAIAAGGSRRR